MLALLAQNWWSFLLRGILALLFGFLALLWPATILVFFAIFALFDGMLALGAAISGFGKNNSLTPTWWLILVGIAGIVAGISTAIWPLLAAFTLTVCIGAWCLARGIFELFGGFGTPSGTAGRGWIIFSAILSIIFGALVLFWPFAGAISIIWIIAFYALFVGFGSIFFAFDLRKFLKNNSSSS